MPLATKYENLTDEELVSMVLGDQEIYLVLMQRYENKLSNYIRKITSFNNEEVEDILQDTFIKAYRYLNDFDQKLKFSSWIYRIAHNESVSHFRKKKARPKLISVEDNDVYLSQTLRSNQNIELDVEKKMQGDEIAKILANMDTKYKEILVLRFFEEKDYKEISDILKKPMGTIGTLLNRAKKAFRDESLKQGINF